MEIKSKNCLTAGLQVALSSDGGQNDETLRRVERGSRIVTVVPQDTRVILQVSRAHVHLQFILVESSNFLQTQLSESVYL